MFLAFAICAVLQGKLEGLVVAGDASPVAGARVILGELGRATLFYNTPEEMFIGTPGLSELQSKQYSALISTDVSGRFIAEGLAPGEYSLIAAEPKHGVAFTTLRLEAGAPCVVRIPLQPSAFLSGSVDGLAFDPTVNVLELKPRAALANISIVPRLAQEPGSWSFRSVALPALREWRLVGTQVVLEQDFRATLFSVPVEAKPGVTTELHVKLDDASAVFGRVLDARGDPLRNVSVVAVSEAEPSRELGGLTDVQGRYRICGLSRGAWRLDAARFGVREVPGCGNGPEEWFGSRALLFPEAVPAGIDLSVSASRPPPAVGAEAPDFTASTLDGRTLQLSKLRGKVVLLDFWATWCGMCRADFPRLLDAYDVLSASARFEIVGVSVDEDADLVQRFVASRGLRWPQTALGAGAKNSVARLYNVHSTPSTVLIDADGKVVALNLTGEALRARIEALLAVK